MLYYKHLCVPHFVSNHKEALKAEVSKGVGVCALSPLHESNRRFSCFGIPCGNCICSPEHRDTFKEYLGMKESNITTKEQLKKLLKPGMVIRTVEGECFLWVGGSSDAAYKIALRSEPSRLDRVEIDSTFLEVLANYEIDAVFAHRTYAMKASPALSTLQMLDLLREGSCDSPFVEVVWKRPEPVKEMTVDEISKALGYKVKVVGNEKADD